MTSLATTRAIERTNGHLYSVREEDRVLGPFPGATAICALQDSLGGSDGLLRWAVNLALDVVAASHWSDDEWPAVLARARNAKDTARNLGTAVHDAVDDLNRHKPLRLTPEVAPYVAQYGAALYREGINVLGSERYVVNADIGFGGTYDSLVEIDGERGMLDVKTGKEKPSQRLQLTGLSMGQWHGEAGLEAEPLPQLSNVGWILLLRPDGYELVRHEITPEDRAHFIYLVETYHRIRAWAAQFAPTAVREEAA